MSLIRYPSRMECIWYAAGLREAARRIARLEARFAGSFANQLRQLAIAIETQSPDLHLAGLRRAPDFARYHFGDYDAGELVSRVSEAVKSASDSESTERWFEKFRRSDRASARAAMERAEERKKTEKRSGGLQTRRGEEPGAGR